MMFRKPPKRRPEAFRSETPRLRLARYAVILVLFAGVIWGVWESNNRRTALLQGDKVQSAPAGLSETEQAAVDVYTERFLKEYGIPLVVEVRSEAPRRAVLDALADTSGPAGEPRRVVLIICPKEKRVFFMAPAIIVRALGEDATALAGPLFVPYFASGDWRAGLQEALNRMAKRLDAAPATLLPGRPGAP